MDLLDDFILETFGGKRSTLDQLNDEIKTIDNLTKTVERINKSLAERFDMESKTLRLMREQREAYKEDARLHRRALEIACEELEALKPKGKLCIMAVIDEETAAHCSGQNDCAECLKWHFYKRAEADLYMQQFCKGEIDKANAVHDEIEGRKAHGWARSAKRKYRRIDDG